MASFFRKDEPMRSLFFILILLSACTSINQEVVRGYKGEELTKALKKIQGKSSTEIIQTLGNPAIHGPCKHCGKKKENIYRIIYLKEDMRKFNLEITYDTDANIKCLILDLKQDPSQKKYVFNKTSTVYRARNCTQKSGVIMRFKQILEAQNTK